MKGGVRPATCDDVPAIARVHVASWRTTYRGIFPDDVLENLSVEGRERQWRRALCEDGTGEFVYVALDDGGEVVGFASGGPERTGDPLHAGELYTIYLVAERQGRGLGRALLEAIRARLGDLGFAGMLIWVAADNQPARGFYERMGGRAVRAKRETFFGVEVEEIGYGWS
jgi:ribosomal protein S18 acetylase RimI-like enzyme